MIAALLLLEAAQPARALPLPAPDIQLDIRAIARRVVSRSSAASRLPPGDRRLRSPAGAERQRSAGRAARHPEPVGRSCWTWHARGLTEVGRTVNNQGQTVRQVRNRAGGLIEVVTDTANRILFPIATR